MRNADAGTPAFHALDSPFYEYPSSFHSFHHVLDLVGPDALWLARLERRTCVDEGAVVRCGHALRLEADGALEGRAHLRAGTNGNRRTEWWAVRGEDEGRTEGRTRGVS